jgi:type IV pilus assembly protein PilY1
MGYSFGTPLMVRTAAGWRALVTSGYDNGAAFGGDGVGRVWVLNPLTGAVEATLSTGVGTAANPAGLAHLSRLANTAADDLVRYVYGGDLLGNVWRFDLDLNTATRIAALTDVGGTAQPVTAAVEVGPVLGSATKFFVYAGTGRYLSEDDVPGTATPNAWATQRQTIYGLIDDTSVSAPTMPNLRGSNGATCPTGGGDGDLVCQSLSYGTSTYLATAHAVDPDTKRGWYLDLPTDTRLNHGRIYGKPALTRAGTLALTVNIPTNTLCEPGGRSWFFGLWGGNGGAVPRLVGGTQYFDAGMFLGHALASRVVVITTSSGTKGQIRLSDKTIKTVDVNEPETSTVNWRRIYWRSVR